MVTKVHPLAEIFPLITGEPFERLKADIAENGLREPIVYWRKMLIDGRNRRRACEELGVEPSTKTLGDDEDPATYILAANIHRRHLSATQRAFVAARLATLPPGRPGKNCATLHNYSAESAAEACSVSIRIVRHAQSVLRDGCEELIAMCESDLLAVHKADDFVREIRDKDEQREYVADGPEAVRNATTAWASDSLIRNVGPNNPPPPHVQQVETDNNPPRRPSKSNEPEPVEDEPPAEPLRLRRPPSCEPKADPSQIFGEVFHRQSVSEVVRDLSSAMEILGRVSKSLESASRSNGIGALDKRQLKLASASVSKACKAAESAKSHASEYLQAYKSA